MALYRSPLTVTLWPSSFLKNYGSMIPPAHKAHPTKESETRQPLSASTQPTEKMTRNSAKLYSGSALETAEGLSSLPKTLEGRAKRENEKILEF
ncbi:hypothetical protein TNCV_1263241 [Trichonephila clavipes]|nr:hypothetical protein TNCV_1263241 [Trichonephila clavipes]